jgi:hypothetical protein
MTSQAVSRAAAGAGAGDVTHHMLIPFDDIVAGATVRVAVINGMQYLSVRDLIMHLCDKDMNQANEVWRRMPETHKDELKASCFNFKFPGRGAGEQPVITFPGALKLVMFLPGEAAKQHRASMVTILQRYFAGDPSLLQEIENNAASDSAIAQLARASLAGAGSVEDSLDRKRKRDLEDTQLHALKLKNIDTFTTVMERINPNWRDDARLRLKTEDWAKNVAFNNGVPAITNGEQALTQPISVSQIGQEMGYNLKHGQLCKVGHAVAEMYRAKYGEEPSTHWQWVDGQHRKVKSYTERDRELIEEAIAEVMQ